MRASQLFGLDRLKAIIRALSTPGAVEIAWKSSDRAGNCGGGDGGRCSLSAARPTAARLWRPHLQGGCGGAVSAAEAGGG